MSYKKFSAGSANNIRQQQVKCQSDDLIKDVSTIEIHDNITFEVAASKRRKSLFRKIFVSPVSLFLSACIVSVALFSILPYPESLKKATVAATVFLGIKYPKAETASVTPDIFHSEKHAILSDFNTNAAETDTESQVRSDTGIFPQAITNETKYKIDVSALMSEQYPIDAVFKYAGKIDTVEVFAARQTPEVLIIHTHGTEAYNDTKDEGYRSNDVSSNVVSIGQIIADTLTENGIGAIHCREMFDERSYIKAYSNSYSAVKKYLTEYPSIKYVIDLHRDAVSDGNGGYKRLTVTSGEKAAAQMMFVVGTDEAGAAHPEWTKNLRVVIGIQEELCKRYPDLMRPVNLRKASFNQQLCPGYFILEVGGCADSREEAKNSATIFAEVFSEHIT